MEEEEKVSIYSIKQPSFEGPLELLLSLVEARKLFVNDIALSQVTEEYISYVKNMSSRDNIIDQEKRIADISYFVLIAATLILIKSKSLLPNLELTNEETEKIVDLEQRLKMYQIIKNASIDVKNNFGTQIIFTPVERFWSEPIFSPDMQMTVSVMASAVQDVLKNAPKKEAKLPEVEIKKVINIEEVINSLSDRIQSAMNTSFREFSKSFGAQDTAEAKVHVIVSFLAMLELVREGILDVVQNNSFEDITINKQEIVQDIS